MRSPSLAGFVDILKEPLRRESFHSRLNEKAVIFLKRCFQTILSENFSARPLSTAILDFFERVLIFDSSSWDVNPQLQWLFRGSGGSASAANCKLQLCYNYKESDLLFCETTPGITSDNAYTRTIPSHVQQGDLLLTDLGYFSLDTFSAVEEKKAFYLSRFNLNTNVYDAKTKDRLELSSFLAGYVGDVVDIRVLIGAKVKLPCRMIAMRMSDDVAAKRRRKLRAEAKKKGYKPSRRHLVLAGWTIMITNVDEMILPVEAVWLLYALRWQIELLFKQFKSILQIHKSNTKRGSRLLCEIYGTLIVAAFITIVHANVNSYLWNEGKREVSVEKLAKRIQERAFFIAKLLNSSIHRAVQILTEEFTKILYNCVKGVQKGRLSSLQKLELIVNKGKYHELLSA